MKLILTFLSLTMLLIQSNSALSQNLNQPANWPNTNWSIGGSYNGPALFGNPTTTDPNFAFDDDAAGTGSADNVFVQSPVINLTSFVGLGALTFEVAADIILNHSLHWIKLTLSITMLMVMLGWFGILYCLVVQEV